MYQNLNQVDHDHSNIARCNHKKRKNKWNNSKLTFKIDNFLPGKYKNLAAKINKIQMKEIKYIQANHFLALISILKLEKEKDMQT